MLPTYAAFAGFFGLLYMVDPQGRLERAPGLALARLLMPMTLWGIFLLGVAALMVAALITGRRMWFITALYVYMVAAVVWAGVYTGAVWITPDASFGGGAWPAFLAVACYASSRSLFRREV